MDELSLRHIPELSDTSAISDFSESSFQIPAAARHTDDLLLADNTMDFFNNANDSDTFSTPAPPKPPVQLPLTLAELTPRSKPVRAAPIRSSLRPRPGVATPFRANVAQELSAALSEDLSPFRNQDPSFQIPLSQPHDGNDLLMVDDGDNFLSKEQLSLDTSPQRAPSALTLNQLTPGRPRLHTSVTPTDPPPQHVFVYPLPSTEKIGVEGSPQAVLDSGTCDPVRPSTVPSTPSRSDSVQAWGDTDNPTSPSKKGKTKVLSRTDLTQKQKKVPCGDKAKRRKVAPTGASTNPAKLKPVTASLLRKLSSSSKKPALTLRRRPLQGGPLETAAVSPSGSMVAGSSEPNPPTIHADVKPFRSGGLAGTLLSFGQQLIANTQNPHDSIQGHCEEAIDEHANEMPPEAAIAVHSTMPMPAHSDDIPPVHESEKSVSDQEPVQPVGDRDYLTLSQLSPRKLSHAPTSPAASDSPSEAGALASVADQPTAPSSSSSGLQEGRLSPMRTSVKRAASPAEGLPAPQRKRGKTVSERQEPSSSKELRPRKAALQPSRAKNAPAAAPGPGPASRTRRGVAGTGTTTSTVRATAAKLPAAGADRAAMSRRKPGLNASRSKSGEEKGDVAMPATARSGAGKMSSQSGRSAASSTSNHGRSGPSVVPDGQNVPEGGEVTDANRQSRSMSASGDRPSANLPPTKPTRPHEFKFATSMRTQARSKAAVEQQPDKLTGPGSSTSTSNSNASLKPSHANGAGAGHHPIPDFKALHAAHESTMAQRRAEAHRTVPVGFDFATDARVQERERFEEARRARERELEQQAEERRRQRELEEEAEIRELRRRAVPKANEVPEWYAFAPKRAKAVADGAAEPT